MAEPKGSCMESLRRAHAAAALVAVAATLLLVAVLPSAEAQVVPPLEGTTTSTTTSTTQPEPQEPPPADGPSGEQLADGSNQAPPGAQDAGGDGAAPPASGIAVPPEARRIIDSVVRSGPSDNRDLLSGLARLTDLGLSRDEAMRVGLGRFPIAGEARYGHDWLFPRYGPGFRFHLGTDVFAAAGTPLRAPVDGIARSRNGGLGGLTVKVFMPDGTYFYMAHLSRLAEGFVDGMAVKTGDIVGYVGDSGNARGGAPHLHLGIYPHGGPPIDPKPVLDQFLAEAQARLPEVIAAYEAARPAAPEPPATIGEAVAPLGAEGLGLFAAGAVRLPTEVLYAAGASPVQGPRALVELALEDLVAGIDWEARSEQR